MKVFLSALSFLFCTTFAFGFGEPKNSKVEITSANAGDQLEFTFKVSANAGHSVTFEAPWKLDLKNHDGLAFASSSFNKDNMDEALPGYKVKTNAKPGKQSGEFEYSLVSFICTTDKTTCYREVHKGKHPWTLTKK